MNYELAKKLKDNGFPQYEGHFRFKAWIEAQNIKTDYTESHHPEAVHCPTLSELIEACGEDFWSLTRVNKVMWGATVLDNEMNMKYLGEGSTPEEAVANLWLMLQSKNVNTQAEKGT